MKTRSLLTYSILRLAAFIVPFVILMIATVPAWISAIVAALFGLAFSTIFLTRPRDEVAKAIYERRHREKASVHPDDESEDGILDDDEPAGASLRASEGERPAEADADDERHEAR